MGELGDRLRSTRDERGLTLEDAERDTRISKRYLQALESEQFEIIPAPVYARGFLRSYSQYLGLDPQEMLELFPRDEGGFPSPGTLRPSKSNPLPGTSASRPSWNRPKPTPARSSTPPFPGAQHTTQEMLPAPPDEPTIGIDIAMDASKPVLNPTASGSARAALVLALASIVIGVVLALAWLISRTGEDVVPPGTIDSSPVPGSTTASETASPTASGPVVPRGVVPDVVGLPAEDAVARIMAAGYESSVQLESSVRVARGNVTDQAPVAGTQLSERQVVTILVSDGP